MKIAAFDLEIAKDVTGVDDWKEERPLGISCAAVYLDPPLPEHGIGSNRAGKEDWTRWRFWWGAPYMSRLNCAGMVSDLMGLRAKGYTFVTWNGLNFDFDVLGEESGLPYSASHLAMTHVDLMFIVVALRGHYLGLDKACSGMGVEGKLKSVTLKDGSKLHDMSGARAPELWAEDEFDAVMDYLADDVRSTAELARAIEDRQRLRWMTSRGRLREFPVARLYTVEECLELPKPRNTGWMTNPPQREDMVAWVEKARASLADAEE